MSWHHTYVGIPFVDGGRDMGGCDCWGLVRLIYRRELGITLPSYGEISARDLIAVSRAVTFGHNGSAWQAVQNGAGRAFDVVVMAYPGKRIVGHVGLITGAGDVLHTEHSSASVVIPINHWSIRERIKCMRRHI